MENIENIFPYEEDRYTNISKKASEDYAFVEKTMNNLRKSVSLCLVTKHMMSNLDRIFPEGEAHGSELEESLNKAFSICYQKLVHRYYT